MDLCQSEELKTWFASCPNLSKFETALEQHCYLNGTVCCDCCGEEYQRKNLRRNIVDPYSDGRDLICICCFESWTDGVMLIPTSTAKWQDQSLPTHNFYEVPELHSGILLNKGTAVKIGTFEEYNPLMKTAVIQFDRFGEKERGVVDLSLYDMLNSNTALMHNILNHSSTI